MMHGMSNEITVSGPNCHLLFHCYTDPESSFFRSTPGKDTILA